MPRRTITTLQREQQRASKGSVLPSATVAKPHPARPNLASPYRASPELLPKESSREPLARLRAAVCNFNHATPCLAFTRPALPCLTLLGLTPKAAQLDQATSASMRLRVAVTGSTSASKRPCLGRQSPSPTSLPASLAISSTSRKFNTSGSY
jgi:hypothetical protein